MRDVKHHLFPICLVLVFFVAMTVSFWPRTLFKAATIAPVYNETREWQAPDERSLPFTAEGDQIRYGKELIVHTSVYLGPTGTVAAMSNGMNCQNCHLNAGRENFANPFSAVASTYPKFRERSGQVESIEFRINECMQRSLNGKALDNSSAELKAMVAYIKWIGNAVPKGVTPRGAVAEALPYLERAADTIKGRGIYLSKCQRCHGVNGNGVWSATDREYTYPPLWGDKSYNVSAGLFRLSRLAGFIKNNMPFGVGHKAPELTNEQAWDVAAYIASQPRPQTRFAYDWPAVATKPLDFPFGPYADSFPEQQHKYGPFKPIKNQYDRKIF